MINITDMPEILSDFQKDATTGVLTVVAKMHPGVEQVKNAIVPLLSKLKPNELKQLAAEGTNMLKSAISGESDLVQSGRGFLNKIMFMCPGAKDALQNEIDKGIANAEVSE